jgi:hypothetical protein
VLLKKLQSPDLLLISVEDVTWDEQTETMKHPLMKDVQPTKVTHPCLKIKLWPIKHSNKPLMFKFTIDDAVVGSNIVLLLQA